jgi:cation transporter-like permease
LDPDNLAVPIIAALSNLVSSTLLFLLTLPLIT